MKKALYFLGLVICFFIFQNTMEFRNLALSELFNDGVLDEHDYIWVGKSFLQGQMTSGWSDFQAYEQDSEIDGRMSINQFLINIDGVDVNYKNAKSFSLPILYVPTVDYGKGDLQIRYIAPYFDHPPLGGIIMAAFNPANSVDEVNITETRKSMNDIALITSLLIFTFGFLIGGFWVGLLSFLVYATVPTNIFITRLALAENIIIPFALISFIFLDLYSKTKNKLLAVASGLFAGACGLCKVPGLFVLLSGVIYLFIKDVEKLNFKKSLVFGNYKYFTIPGLLVFLLYPLYGLLISPDLFKEVIFSQVGREYPGPILLIESITKLSFKDAFFDGWWIGGWVVSLLVVVKYFNKHKFLALSFLSYIFVMLFMAAAKYPWYFITALPFLCVFTASFLKKLVIKPNVGNILIFMVLFFSGSFYWGYYVLNIDISLNIFRVFLVLFFIFILNLVFIKNKFITYGWFPFIILLVHRLFVWNIRSFTYLIENLVK